nr:ribonuclease H [Mimivirus sp.]
MYKKTRKIDIENVIVFTDGSCVNNGRKHAVGGIGIHFPDRTLNDISRIFTKGCCTNQRTELYAILYAIKYVHSEIGLQNCILNIFTDSQYSINCITKWVPAWIKNNWKTKIIQLLLTENLLSQYIDITINTILILLMLMHILVVMIMTVLPMQKQII